MKQKFINKEIWLLSTMGAFQRANIYRQQVSETVKSEFKANLHAFINQLIENVYKTNLSEEKHIKMIWSVSEYTKNNFTSVLNKGQLNFGVSQKLLNLYLKYLWCLECIPTPPHFPVDRIIQNKLKVPKLYAWTQIESEKPYLEIIQHAKQVLQNSTYSSLAELELHTFNRS
ncbi:hypothetical protein [Aquimarina agarivorans]|uniref:hypothetical protein n=1 Tax=Aquimarina agarivorans TaxID=980584 RepID=UPI000248F5A6|nr:hypothetical protein [Aquimarina agarivorans]